MLSIKAKHRETTGKKVEKLRKAGMIPAVLYGPKIKSQAIEISLKDFKKVYTEAGESSLISLELDSKKIPVLIHETAKNPLTLEISHVDFYQPQLDKEVEATVPLVFEGVSLAVKDLEGTLIKEIQEVKVRALPQNLPHNIKVDISQLSDFEKEIKIRDLKVPDGVKVMKDEDEIVALAVPPAKVEEELEKPIEEKVEEVEKVETKKEKAEEAPQTEEAKAPLSGEKEQK